MSPNDASDGPPGRTDGTWWIDGHCHLDMVDQTDLVLGSLRGVGVIGVVTIGTDLESSRTALELARAHDQVWTTAGLHPHDASVGMDGLRDLVEGALEADDPLVAIGECGLDYHYDNSPRQAQRDVFAQHVAMANEFDLPLVVHTRDAWDDTFDILDSESVPVRTVIHCFTGGPDEALACLERGAFLSISGIVTFRNASDVRDAVRVAPIDRLIAETDSPFLTPVPHRGKPNTPLMVPLVGAALADIKEVSVEHMAEVTTATASAFYGLGIDPDLVQHPSDVSAVEGATP